MPIIRERNVYIQDDHVILNRSYMQNVGHLSLHDPQFVKIDRTFQKNKNVCEYHSPHVRQ